MAVTRGASAGSDLRKRAGGGRFLTLSDGDELKVAFVGVLKYGLEGDNAEPAGVEVVWVDNKSVEYDPAEHDADDVRATFLWNVFVRGTREAGGEEGHAQIFQQGPRFFDQFIRHKDKKGYNYWFTLGREGSKRTDTKYFLDREDPLTDAELKMLTAVKTRDLMDAFQGSDDDDDDDDKSSRRRKDKERGKRRSDRDATHTTTKSSRESTPREREPDRQQTLPIHEDKADNGKSLSIEQREQLKEKIMSLPNMEEVRAAVVSRYGLPKLLDLPSSKFDDAMAFVDSVAAAAKKTTTSGVVDDPFFS